MNKVTFKDLGLSSDVLKGIEMMGYVSPSPIQEKSIPVLLEGQDIIGQAQTVGQEKHWLLACFVIKNTKRR